MIGVLACFVKKEDSRQSLIGFTIASSHWRNGYALEVIHRLLEFLFEEMDMHRITADCDVDNIASGRTLKKLGFRREAHFVESFPVNGVYTSEYHFGLLQREWRENLKGG
ncbi:MAG TPA: GNAT family protein [Anaerolineales bacterium]|nr:GNAT family protein [Anaerolineales bacterium]